MRLKFKTREEKLSDLAEFLPDGNFIAVFGTSHTSGICKRGDSEAIAHEDIWASIVGSELNLEVVNASNPGNDNETIIQQLIDFLDMPGVLERCKHIIGELRVAEGTTRFGRDLFGNLEILRRAEFVPQLTNSYFGPKLEARDSDGGLVGHITVADKLLSRLTTSFLKLKKKEQMQLLQSMVLDVNQPAVGAMHDIVMDILHSFSNYENVSMLPFVKDYNHIRTMSALCRAHNIGFNWFCWDEHAQFEDPTEEYKVVKSAFKQTTDVFDTEVVSLAGSAHKHFVKSLPPDVKFSDFNCECGHQNEGMHRFVADNIINNIKEIV